MNDFRFFAEIVNGIVTRVLTVHPNEMLNENGIEQESLGQTFLNNLIGESNWALCSNDGFRKQFPMIGSTFNSVDNVFIQPQPYPSWTLDDNFDWQPPTPMPVEEGKKYVWFEPNRVWIELI
jgi:hypothetical protein